jgi:glutaredoxin
MFTIIVACLSFSLVGCDRSSEPEATAQGAAKTVATSEESISFEVDGQGVRYLYRTGYGGARSKLKLEDVPMAYRGAVAVHVSGKTDDATAGEQAYLAELYEAKPGEKAKAYLHDQKTFQGFSRAGIDAARTAVEVKKVAMETAEMTPGSDFHEHMMTTLVLEHPSTGQVERKRVRIKRAGGSEPEPKTRDSWSDRVGESWKDAFGDEAEKESGAQDKSEKKAPWRRVVMYSTPWCPACKTAKKWLEQNDVPYDYRDVSSSQTDRREMRRYCTENGMNPGAVPTFRIGDQNKMMQGWHAGRFERLAKK